MYQVLFQFQSLEDLVNWNKQFGKLANKKPATIEGRDIVSLSSSRSTTLTGNLVLWLTIEQTKNDKPDNRGSKTKEMHTRAKEYHQANPTLTYRECFVKVSKNQV